MEKSVLIQRSRTKILLTFSCVYALQLFVLLDLSPSVVPLHFLPLFWLLSMPKRCS